MNLLPRISVICLFLLVSAGCGGADSGRSWQRQPSARPESDIRGEARKVILDYVNRYEEIYLHHEGPDMETKLSEVTDEYHRRISDLAKEGKWTPAQEMGTSIKLSFLIGRFQGGLQSCKIERANRDKTLVGCEQVRKLRNEIEELCSK